MRLLAPPRLGPLEKMQAGDRGTRQKGCKGFLGVGNKGALRLRIGLWGILYCMYIYIYVYIYIYIIHMYIYIDI